MMLMMIFMMIVMIMMLFITTRALTMVKMKMMVVVVVMINTLAKICPGGATTFSPSWYTANSTNWTSAPTDSHTPTAYVAPANSSNSCISLLPLGLGLGLGLGLPLLAVSSVLCYLLLRGRCARTTSKPPPEEEGQEATHEKVRYVARTQSSGPQVSPTSDYMDPSDEDYANPDQPQVNEDDDNYDDILPYRPGSATVLPNRGVQGLKPETSSSSPQDFQPVAAPRVKRHDHSTGLQQQPQLPPRPPKPEADQPLGSAASKSQPPPPARAPGHGLRQVPDSASKPLRSEALPLRLPPQQGGLPGLRAPSPAAQGYRSPASHLPPLRGPGTEVAGFGGPSREGQGPGSTGCNIQNQGPSADGPRRPKSALFPPQPHGGRNDKGVQEMDSVYEISPP
ncbi:basic salivary proline-rich protein 2-like isoform X1 [Lethenteron reissneri]|uniref:basic salivary proline-rich protein 2-like isoform X1 n=2 Tax=Lethenteron reissneri TaxID=7753 RepID=UPI002AB64B60|nr:basic salivary proline-rich protein 2-like isoform X1 [Lethenteron reissneri]